MSLRARVLLSGVLAAAMFELAPARSRAQDASDVARDAFQRGMIALQGNRFQDAVEALEASRAHRAVPVVYYNLGLAYRGLGRSVDAVSAFERYLREPEADAPRDRIEALRGEVARLRAGFVTLHVTLRPSVASLRVDGRSVVLVDRELVVDPGARSVDVTAPGHLAAHQDVSLAPGGRVELDVQLVPTESRARLLVEPSVLEALVYVDHRLTGVGLTEARVAPGPHVVEVRAPGHQMFRREVRAEALGVHRVFAALERPDAPRRARWIVPVAIAGGALLVAGAIVGVAWLARGDEPIRGGRWGTFCEMGCP